MLRSLVRTVVPTSFSANPVLAPLCTRVFEAEVSGTTAVPTRFSANFRHPPLCTAAFVLRCQVRLCLLASLQFSVLSSGKRRSLCPGEFVTGVSGTAVPARFSATACTRR